jgi:hypothetical protein
MIVRRNMTKELRPRRRPARRGGRRVQQRGVEHDGLRINQAALTDDVHGPIGKHVFVLLNQEAIAVGLERVERPRKRTVPAHRMKSGSGVPAAG